MSLKDKQESEVMSVYDPTLDAFHEVETSKVKKHLLSLGLTEQEADDRIKKMKEAK